MRKVYTAIFTLSIAACFAIANISTLSSQEKALKKLYISSIQASGVPEPLAKKARERIEFALYENFGREYRVLTDEDVKVMFKKAQAIMATSCTAESCQTEIADAVDADEIIYGELTGTGLAQTDGADPAPGPEDPRDYQEIHGGPCLYG
jgi:hypothetical protein